MTFEITTGLSKFSLPQVEFQKASLLGYTRFWKGSELPTRVGRISSGYSSIPSWLYTEKSDVGYLSFGPYVEFPAGGLINSVLAIVEVTDRGGSSDDVLTIDVVDHPSPAILERTFKVSDFPSGTDTFGIYGGKISIPTGSNIETRIYKHSGATLKLWGLNWTWYHP